MDEHFYQSTKLSKDKMVFLMQRNDRQAMIRFTVMYVLFIMLCIAVVNSWHISWWKLLLSQLGFGIICCSMFAAEHETSHNTAFKSRYLNKLTSFLAGVAHLFASTAFRELHFTHHRHTHIPGLDPEISLGNKPAPSVIANLPLYFAWLSGLPLLLFKIAMLVVGAIGMPEVMRKNFFSFIRPQVRRSLAIESRVILLVYGYLLYLTININTGFAGLFIGQIVGHCMLAYYLTPEHNGLPHEGNIMDRTRHIRTSKFVKLFMWNMPYHAEHHAYPAIPFHALPKLHEEIIEEIKHKNLSHAEFHTMVLENKF